MTTVSQEAREAAAALMPMNTMAECEYVVALKAGKHDGDYRLQAFAKFEQSIRQSAERGEAWRPIETAPYDTPVEVKVGSMTFLARLLADASMSSLDETCDQWQAEIDGEHPPCWSGGACWASNENEDMSLQPTAWRPTTPPEAA